MNNAQPDTGCCPRFNPAPWDGRELEWQNKRFVKGAVCTLIYMPLNYGLVMKRIQEKIDQHGGHVPDGMWLSDHTSRWNMDLYVAVDREIPGADNVTLSGKFISKVYEGAFRNTRTWMQDFEKSAKEQGHKIKNMYLWYTTCPKCAKKYGKNYVVILARV